MDVFQGLKTLSIGSGKTNFLIDLPLRSLEELVISEGYFTLNEADFPAVRRQIEEHDLKVTIDLFGDVYAPEDEPKFRAELDFWKPVKNATVSGFENLIFDSEEEI